LDAISGPINDATTFHVAQNCKRIEADFGLPITVAYE
jgi:hypothetical protein